jgi:hypothetical protein
VQLPNPNASKDAMRFMRGSFRIGEGVYLSVSQLDFVLEPKMASLTWLALASSSSTLSERKEDREST